MFQKIYPAEPLVTTPPCIHLRNKAMYVHATLGDPDASFPEETNAPQCWCELTQHFLGPDSQYVNRQSCTPDRPCYKETY